jgi:hypothetical protein
MGHSCLMVMHSMAQSVMQQCQGKIIYSTRYLVANKMQNAGDCLHFFYLLTVMLNRNQKLLMLP